MLSRAPCLKQTFHVRNVDIMKLIGILDKLESLTNLTPPFLHAVNVEISGDNTKKI